MYLSSIEADGFRNLSDPIAFAHPVSVVVGANNSGKSNLIDAIRLVLTPQNGWPFRPRRTDFHHGGTGEPVDTELLISARFENLSLPQSGRMLTAIDGQRDRSSLHLRATLPPAGRPVSRFLGGQGLSQDVEDWARTAATYTYLPPLRDVEADMRPGRNNRLVELISAIAGEGPDRQAVVEIAKETNSKLSKVDSLSGSTGRIAERLSSMAGSRKAQRPDLLFADPVFEQVLSTLGIAIGDDLPIAMSHNGLGMNNLLYMAVILAGLTYNHESDLHILLVEEPEAHLHPQMQDLLMRFLQAEVEEREDVQVIVTTHSPNITSSVSVEQITSMTKLRDGVTSRFVGGFGLDPDEVDHLARFLDVTKASLLFADAVILVEGLAEQLLLPLLSKMLSPGIDLANESVTLINVGGLAFGPFAALYEDGRLPTRCSIVSDGDPQEPESEEGADDESAPDPVLSATAQKLKSQENDRRRVFLAEQTFEHDLVKAGNWRWAIDALALLKPRVAKRLEASHQEMPPEAQADAILDAIADRKGRFAQALLKTAGQQESIQVPKYIAEAVKWVSLEPAGESEDADGGQSR